MSINLKQELDRLKRSTGQIDDREARPKDAEKTVEIIAGHFESRSLSNAQLELAIETVLNKRTGCLLATLKVINHHNREFTGVSKALLELYLKLIKDHSQKVQPYTTGLNVCATKVVVHCKASAREKELAIQIIKEMMEKRILPDDQFPELFDQLFSILPGDKPERFSQHLFQLMGSICRWHPDQVPVAKALKFRKELQTKLENFGMKRNSISFLIASGAMDGLNACFMNFPPDPASEGDLVFRVYGIVKVFCEPDKDISDRSVFRSALAFFKAHVQLFSEYILRDAVHWHDVFKEWFKSIRADDKPFVVPAVYAFYNQVAAAMKDSVDGERQHSIELLTRFLDHFKNVLLDSQSAAKPFQIRLAILSLGILSGPAKALLSTDVVDELVNIVIASTNYAYFSELADKRDKIEHLPDFIQSLSLLLEQLDGISPAQLSSLENIIAALMQDFHFLSVYHHPLVIRSLVHTFHNVSKLGGTIVEDLLAKVILQAIIWTCSHKLPMDTFQDEEEQDWKKNITFRNYLPLWRGLLANIEAVGFDQKPIRDLIAAAFFKNVIVIIRKLDLSTTKRKFVEKDGTESELFYCDPDSDLMPQRASDFQIFFNLVSLCQDVLAAIQPGDIQRHLPMWFELIVRELILKSYEYPLISGFIKLIELFLTLGYRSVKPFEGLLGNDLKADLIAYFKVTLNKARSSSGELQLACLKLIFKAPDVIVQALIEDMVDIFEMGFVIGKSVLWLAEVALTCLERNIPTKCDPIKEQLLRKILPLFDNFLLSKSSMNSEFGQREPANPQKPNKRRTKWQKLSKPPADLTDEDRDLCRVQKKMLLFLGTLEPGQCLYLIESEANLENLTKWDIERNVKLPIYCYDEGIQPELLLDNLIPRVFHLARAATDRQTKLAACEFIHGVILYVIGTRNLNSRRLWTEICRGMIELACDSDTAVQQMFEPLMMQVMHFKALPAEWSNGNSSNAILLEVIMSCLSDRRDPALRDMAAKGLRELLSWSLEMANDKQQMMKTVVRDVINIINFNSVDYNMERRLGAALAFNNIYRLLRENELIVDLYWMMLLYSFSNSLWICDQSESVSGVERVVEQVENSLDHVIRVMVERPEIFALPNEDRLMPEEEAFGQEATMKEAVDYVFKLSSSSAPRIRRKAQEMFLKLCPKAFEDVESYLKDRHDVKVLREMFEGKLIPFDMLDWTESSQSMEFLQEVLVVLEGYKFILGDCQVNESVILGQSLVFRDMRRLLEFIFNAGGSEAWDLLSKHKINQLVANCIPAMIQFWSILAATESGEFSTFLEENKSNLQLMLVGICFEDLPERFPVNLKTVKAQINNLLEVLGASSSYKAFLNELLKHLAERINLESLRLEEYAEMFLSRESITIKETSTIHGLLMAKKVVLGNADRFPNMQKYKENLNVDCLRIAKLLFESCKTEVVATKSIKPAVKDYANSILEFCLKENHTAEAIDVILGGIILSDEIKLRDGQGKASVGQLFRNVFKYPILEFLLSTAATEFNVIRMICDKMNVDNANDLLLILNEVIEFVFKRSNQSSQVQEYIFEGVVAEWPKIFGLISTKEDSVMLIYDLVSHLGLIVAGELYSLGERLAGFSEWLLGMLKSCNSQTSLDVKSKMINLLPIVTGPVEDDQPELYRILKEFRSGNLPQKSTEFKGNSLERAKLGVIMKNLLEALRISRSLTIFKFLISATVAEERHTMEYEIRSTVTQLIASLEAKDQLKFLNESVKMALDTSMEPLLRLNLFKRFIKTALRASKEAVLIGFYETQIGIISDLIESNYSLLGEDRNYYAIETALVSRMIGLYLLELLFGSLRVEQMNGIARVLRKPDVKKIVGDFSRKCVEARREIFLMNYEPINELFRQYQCGAYRALCMIVMTTQTELRFFERLLFPASGKDFIWPKIISSKRGLFQADFVSDFEDFPKVKERIVSMKAENASLLGNLDGESNKFRTLNNLFSSSLSQDVTKLDFTSRLVSTEQVPVRNVTVRLEDLAMNNHELMPTLCAVIQHLFDKKITPVPETMDTFLKSTPDWVKSLAHILQDRDAESMNIRLFVGRLVENCQERLVNYAPALFGPVLQLIVDQGNSDGGLNVYNMDLIQMLVKWTNHYKLASIEEKELASKAIQFMVRNCHSSNFDVMKLNLEIIRIVVTAWKDVILVPPRQLLNDLIAVTATGQSNEASSCGLQLNAIFLVNDMTPWSVVSQLDYLKTLFVHLDSPSSSVYQTAAQILGYFFALEGDSTEGANYLALLNAKLKRIDRRKEEKRFADVLYGIHLQFPAILDHPEIPDPFIKIIVESIPAAIKTMKVKYLAMLLARAEYFEEDIFNEILAIGLLDLLKLREYQLYVLHIINKSLKRFSDGQRDDVLNHISPIIKSELLDCRLVAYEILIQLYATATSRRPEIAFTIIRGFRDAEESIQNRLLTFWSEEAQLPFELSDRFHKVVEIFAGVEHMNDFLEFTAQLLLAVLIKNPNSKRQLFPNENLFDNKLMEYEINVSWRTQNLSRSIPLFAKSLSSNFAPGQSTLTFKDQSQLAGNLQFEPTQDVTQMQSLKVGYSIPTQSSFVFNARGQQTLNKNSQAILAESQQLEEATNPLKKRLIRDKEKSARNVAVQMIDKRRFEQQRKLYKRRDKDGKIVLYRRYRYGDFPDFLINNLAILLPLQALVKKDQLIARKVFVGLFQSLVESLEAERKESLEFCQRMSSSIKDVLGGMKYCNSNVYASFMELAFFNPLAMELPLELTVNISLHNNTAALAALVLENTIIHYDASQHGQMAKRRPGGSKTAESAIWMNVAELYKATKDSEIVAGIFADKLDSDPELVKAIELESNGRFLEAQKIYTKIIHSVQRLEKDYCYEAFFNCFLEMGEWDRSIQVIEEQMGDWDQLWTDDWNQENLLPNMIHSQLKGILDGEVANSNSDFLRRLEAWLKNDERRNVIKMNFPEELIMFHIVSKNYLAARALTEENIWSFASEWGHLSVLSENVRRERLLDIRIVAEIDKYIELLIQAPGETQLKDYLNSVLNRWLSSEPRKSDSLLMWDFLFSCRRFFGEEFCARNPAIAKHLQEMKFDTFDKSLKLAVTQRNSQFADKLLSKMVVLGEEAHLEMFEMKCKLARSSHQILKAELRGPEKGFKTASEALKRLAEGVLNSQLLTLDTEFHLSTVLDSVELIQRAYRVFKRAPLTADQQKAIISSIPGSSGDDLGGAVHKYILSSFMESVQLAEDFPENFKTTKQLNAIRDTNFKLAQYCFDYVERSPGMDPEEKTDLQKIIITSLFDSLRLGSEDGQKLFPSILRFKKEAPLRALFVEKCRQVGAGMFLKWIPQLLSHLNFVKEGYLDDLIQRIAVEYPMALYFPFELSYEQFKFQTPAAVDRPLIQRIREALFDPKMKLLVMGLSSVCLPNIMFVAHVTNLLRALKVMGGKDFTDLLKKTVAVLFPEEVLMRGTQFRKYSKTKGHFEAMLKFDVSNSDQKESVKKSLEDLKKSFSSNTSSASSIELEDLCPWLAHFSSVNGADVEIPGQYSDWTGGGGESYKFKDSVKIMKFGNKIGVFGSKTRPVKITIYGSDGRQYNFLLKYSEDLRQDQRIQQILKLMSDNLALDKQGRAQKLKIVTYNVIPITDYFGMLSWVPDTVPMHDFVRNSLVYNSKETAGNFDRIRGDFEKFLRVHSTAGPLWEMYSETVEKATAGQLRDKFRELSNKLPADLLRQAIIEISASPESFFLLRNNFCRTMAAMNIAHWILGVGDRHLLNILMDVKTCQLIGIDFNVVFESGFRVLPIPELMPFRLTPQFVNVMSPYGVTGVIKSAMVHSLRVFRSEQKLFLTCLEVFLREPTIDWLYNAIHVQDDPAEFNTLSTDTRVHWEPSERLMAVKEKLSGGVNPVRPIARGLQVGFFSNKPAALEAYTNVLRGTERENIRARLPDGNLTVEQQIDCLLDLATDPAVLGITFVGLNPWL